MSLKDKHIIDELEVHPVTIPDDAYFEAFKSKMLDELKSEKTTRVVPLYKRWYVWSSAAAAILILITLFTRFQNSNYPTETPDFTQLSKQEVINYLDDNIEFLDDELLTEHVELAETWTDSLPVQEIIRPVKTVDKVTQESSFDELDREEILEYLQREGAYYDEELLID